MESAAARGPSPSILDYDVFELAGRVFDAYPEPEGLEDFGPYQIRGRIDKGGMGEVWRAYDYIACREVAIKIPRYLSDPDLRRRFAMEVTHQAKLEHPFIARLYDHGICPDGTPYFAMEFVDGKPLDEYCRDKNLPPKERVTLLRAVCEAVQYAHGLLVVHRDLKPSNILVREDGTPKLLDFGVSARLVSAGEPARQTQTEVGFTRAFAAPEQFRREPVGVYTDVYALGVILYQLLSGRLPYDLEHCTAGQAELLVTGDGEPAKPSEAGRKAGDRKTGRNDWNDLDVLCLTALKKDVNDRYKTVLELGQDIDRYLNGEPLEARREGLGYRVRKFVGRNRRAVLAAGLTAALVIGLVVFFTLRLAKERNTALAEAARRHQIQDFMLTLFGSADDQAAPSKELRVVTLLDRGAKQAAVLNSDPETQAELYEILGRMYYILGRYPQADELLRLAWQKMRSAVGPEDVRNVEFMVELGALRSDQGQSQEAERLVREGLNLASRHLPPNDTTVLGAKSGLGRVLVQRGAYDKAIALLGPVSEIPPSGKEGTDVLVEALGALAVANQYSGHYDVAEELNRRVLALDRKTYGDSHPKVAVDLANLATALVTAGRASEGEQLYREASGILQGWYGGDHPATLQVESFVALLQVRQNKLAEAEPLLRGVLVAQEGNYGKNHPYVGFVLDTLGQLERKRGHLSEARAHLDRALKIFAASFGEADAKTAMVRAHVGDVLEDGGHYADAERTYTEALRSLLALPLKGSVNVGVVEAGLGRALLRQRRYSEAENHLLSGYAALMAKPSSYPDRLAQVRDDLGTEYLALHEPEKAARYHAP